MEHADFNKTCTTYLMGPYNAGPKSVLFLRVALIKAGVRGAGVIMAILERDYHVFEKLSYFEIWSIVSLACTGCPIKNASTLKCQHFFPFQYFFKRFEGDA